VLAVTEQVFATSVLFRVFIGAIDLGSFTTCDGLACEVQYEEIWEGGLNVHPWILPSRLHYSNIVLTRPLTASTISLGLWLRSQVLQPVPTIGQISALAPDRRTIARWSLDRVLPVRWQGPSFSAEASRPAMETLELAHHGFLVTP
jgi:phage tail-like protein